MFDLVEIREAMPKQHRSKITEQFIGDLNKMIQDPAFGERYADNIVTFSSVLQEGRFKVTDYFNACKFTTHMMLGDTSIDAYKKTFPAKYADMVARNVSQKDISAYASTYKATKLVTAIYEQTLVADHIMYASIRHRAIRRQAELMMSSNENVAQKAADSLMNHLKAPETAKLTVDVATTDTGIIADLSKAIANLSIEQSRVINSGGKTLQDIAHSDIIEVEDV